jgi:hypothetical protein
MKTQLERVKGKILRDGYITRNECLRNYISRLSAIIYTLESKYDMIFKTEEVGGDYKYILLK